MKNLTGFPRKWEMEASVESVLKECGDFFASEGWIHDPKDPVAWYSEKPPMKIWVVYNGPDETPPTNPPYGWKYFDFTVIHWKTTGIDSEVQKIITSHGFSACGKTR